MDPPANDQKPETQYQSDSQRTSNKQQATSNKYVKQPKAKVISNPDLAPEPQGATAAAQGAPGEPQREPRRAPGSPRQPRRPRQVQGLPKSPRLGGSRSPKCPIHIKGVYREPIIWRQGPKTRFWRPGPSYLDGAA